MENTKKTGVIYARQSYGDGKNSLSINQQIARCKAWAEKNEVEIKGIFKDLDTSSELYPDSAKGRAYCATDIGWQRWRRTERLFEGRKAYRKGLAEAFAMIEGEKIDFFIVDENTRFYRNPISTAQLDNFCIVTLQEAKTALVNVSENKIDYLTNNVNIAMWKAFAQYEMEKVNEKAMASRMNRRKHLEEGFVFSNAYGIDWKNKKISYNARKIEAVKYVFTAVISGKTYGEILHTLNSKYKHLADGKCFYETSVYNIIRNPVYCGFRLMDNGEFLRIRNLDNPPQISFIEFQKANEVLRSKKEGSGRQKYNVKDQERRHFLPFSGLITCGNCGRRLVVRMDRGLVYCCKETHLTKNKGCTPSRIRLNWDQDEDDFYLTFQPLFLLTIQKMMIDLMKIKNANEEKASIGIEIENLKNRLKNLTASFADGTIEYGIFKPAVDKLKAGIIEKQNELMKISAIADEDKEAELQKFRELMDQLQWTETRIADDDYARLARETIKGIVVFEDRIKVILFDGNSFDLPRILINKRGQKKLPLSIGETYINKQGIMSFKIIFETGNAETLLKGDFYRIETR